MSERTTSQVVGATLIGGMVGAGVALLLAPRSGKETRQQIQAKAQKARDTAAERLSRARSRIGQGVDEAKDLKDRLKEAAQSTGRKAKTEMSELKSETIKKRKQSPVLSAWEEEV